MVIDEIINEIKYGIKLDEKNNDECCNDIFFNSVKNNVPRCFMCHYSNSIEFYSNSSIVFLNDFIINDFSSKGKEKSFNYELSIKLIKNIIKQIQFLEKHNYSFINITPNDILFVNGIFVIINDKYLIEINKNKNIVIDFPAEKNSLFVSPEIMEIKEIPQEINFKHVYYSLGATLIFVYLKKNIKLIDDIENELKKIYGTSLYWFIIKSTDSYVNKRILML